MTRAIIIYDSKYGNTRMVGEAIADGLKQSGAAIALRQVKEARAEDISAFDIILIGSPNHMGGPLGDIKKLIETLGKLGLEGKKIAFFDTYMAADHEKALKKMERLLSQKASGWQLLPGISLKVDKMKGPLAAGEIERARDFGKKLATA